MQLEQNEGKEERYQTKRRFLQVRLMRFRMFHELKLMVLGLFSGLRALGNGIIYICLSHSLFFVSSLSLYVYRRFLFFGNFLLLDGSYFFFKHRAFAQRAFYS